MRKLSDLQRAVANRQEDIGEIEEDLEFVEQQFDAFRKYFNSVYEDVCAGESAKVFLSSGRWTTEQYQDKIVSLDRDRRLAHDRAVDACKILNRMCDSHDIEHICPDVYDRATVADYVGTIMQEYYQEGLSKQREKDARASLDVAFDNAKKEERNPQEAYKRKSFRKKEEELEL